MQIIALVAGLGSIVCWIITLIQLFKKESVIMGILGIICGIYAFIWGWLKVKETNQKTIMLVWTVCIIVGVITNVMTMQDAMN